MLESGCTSGVYRKFKNPLHITVLIIHLCYLLCIWSVFLFFPYLCRLCCHLSQSRPVAVCWRWPWESWSPWPCRLLTGILTAPPSLRCAYWGVQHLVLPEPECNPLMLILFCVKSSQRSNCVISDIVLLSINIMCLCWLVYHTTGPCSEHP